MKTGPEKSKAEADMAERNATKQRLNEEAEALRGMILRSAPPAGASDVIPTAPARGNVETFHPTHTVLTNAGPRVRHEQMPAGLPVRVSGGLRRIERASRNRKNELTFTNAQHAAAAEYEALFIRVNAGRVKCSDLEATGGGGADGVMDAAIHDILRLRRIDAVLGYRIKDGKPARIAVLQPRGPSAQAGRRSIWANELVQCALIRQQPLARLLDDHGWSRQTIHLRRLVTGLAAALDRAYGL